MASGPDCISVVILNNFKPELLGILAKLFNMCLKRVLFSRLVEGLIGGPCI